MHIFLFPFTVNVSLQWTGSLWTWRQGFSSQNGPKIISLPLRRDQTCYQTGAGFSAVGSVRLVTYLLFIHLLFTHLLILIPIYPFNNWFVRFLIYLHIYLLIYLFTYSFICTFIYYLPTPFFVYLSTFFINLCTHLLLFLLTVRLLLFIYKYIYR